MRRTLASLAFPFVAAAAAAQEPGVVALVPEGAVLTAEWRDGAALVERTFGFLAAREPLPPRIRGVAHLLPALMRARTGGLGPVDVARAVSPGDAVFAVVPVEERLEPLLVARVGEASPELDRLLERLEGTVAGGVEDGVLALAREPEDVLRYHRWRRQWARAGSGAPVAEGEVRLRIDLRALRERSGGAALFERLDPGGRLLLGPIAEALDAASRAEGQLRLATTGLELAIEIDASALGSESVGALFDGGLDERESSPRPDGTFATLALDRDLGAFFAHLEELVGDAAAVRVRSGLSIADALLGCSLVDDLLPGFDGTPTLFAVAREPSTADGAPIVDLPSFVLVAPVADRELVHARLEQFFRAALTADAVQRRQRGEPLFLARSGRAPDGQPWLWAEPQDRFDLPPWPTESALSPTIAFAERHVVISSTRDGAERALRACDRTEGERVRGDVLEVAAGGLADYVRRNLDTLAFNEVLEKGKTLAEARRGIAIAAEALALFEGARVAIMPEQGATTLSIRLEGTR